MFLPLDQLSQHGEDTSQHLLPGFDLLHLAERFADEISLEHSLIDRMRVRGHVLNLQTITMLRMFFQQVRGVEWIEPQHLQQLTSGFVHFVEQYANLHHIPIIPAKPGESHVDQVPAVERALSEL